MKKSYLLSSMLGAMLFAMPVSADVISMQTTVPVGEKISIALNAGVKATLEWGNGVTESIQFADDVTTFDVKDASLTIKSDNNLMSVFCPDCSLTSLNLTEAPHLVSVVCANNQLTQLDVSKNALLQELNCQNNQLKSISLNNCVDLTTLNVAGNELKTLAVFANRKIKTLICAGNNFSSSLRFTNLSELETFWCQNNAIPALAFSSDAKLSQLCAYNNKIKVLAPIMLQNVQELWVDNNEIAKLDIASGDLQTLSASNNKLTSILLNKFSKNSLQAFYVDGNGLMFNSLPDLYRPSSKDSLVNYNIDNQEPYVFEQQLDINTTYNFTPLLAKNAFGMNVRPKLVWKDANGQELGPDAVKVLGYNVTFKKAFAEVYGEAVSDYYPGATFKFAKMSVLDPTAIESVSDDNSLLVNGNNGSLNVTAAVATTVHVYNVSGALVVDEYVSAGSHSWILPAGMYIVNGKKVLLNR